MLVEKFLYAVVSLPAGVFNPYSGVKTSILLLDRQIARKADTILFIRIENDGFSLGAQRREMTGSDIPNAVRIIDEYVKSIRSEHPESFTPEDQFSRALLVTKEKLAKNGEYTLTGDRYRVTEQKVTQRWEKVKLGEIARIINGRAYKQEELLSEGKYPVLRVGNFFSNSKWYFSDLELEPDKYCDQGDLLYAWSASFGSRIWGGKRAIFHYHIWKIEPTERINKKYLHLFLERETDAIKGEGGRGLAMIHLTKAGMEQRLIPLPPLEVQKEIVTEIEGYQKIIDGARQVVDNWKPQIEIDPEWEMVRLGDVCDLITDGSHFSPVTVESGFPYITVKDIDAGGKIDFINCKKIEAKDFENLVRAGCQPKYGDILFSKDGTVGKVAQTPKNVNFVVLSSLAILRANGKVTSEFLMYSLMSESFKKLAIENKTGVAIKRIVLKTIKSLQIYIPPQSIQQEIVNSIQTQESHVDGCRKLISVYEGKIKGVIDKVWGE